MLFGSSEDSQSASGEGSAARWTTVSMPAQASRTGVGIGDIEADDLVSVARRSRQPIGAQVGQPEAIALAVRLAKRRADAAGGAGEEHESSICHGQS